MFTFNVSPWHMHIKFWLGHQNNWQRKFWQMIVCSCRAPLLRLERAFKAFKNCLSSTFFKSNAVKKLRPWWRCHRWPIPVRQLQLSLTVFLYSSPCTPSFPYTEQTLFNLLYTQRILTTQYVWVSPCSMIVCKHILSAAYTVVVGDHFPPTVLTTGPTVHRY